MQAETRFGTPNQNIILARHNLLSPSLYVDKLTITISNDQIAQNCFVSHTYILGSHDAL